jgi:hypothetical protein
VIVGPDFELAVPWLGVKHLVFVIGYSRQDAKSAKKTARQDTTLTISFFIGIHFLCYPFTYYQVTKDL